MAETQRGSIPARAKAKRSPPRAPPGMTKHDKQNGSSTIKSVQRQTPRRNATPQPFPVQVMDQGSYSVAEPERIQRSPGGSTHPIHPPTPTSPRCHLREKCGGRRNIIRTHYIFKSGDLSKSYLNCYLRLIVMD